MAPELVGGGQRTLKTDIWYVGYALHRLCEAAGKGNSGEMPSTAMFRPLNYRYSKDLVSIRDACLQKDPSLRPDSEQILNRIHERQGLLPQTSEPEIHKDLVLAGVTREFVRRGAENTD